MIDDGELAESTDGVTTVSRCSSDGAITFSRNASSPEAWWHHVLLEHRAPKR